MKKSLAVVGLLFASLLFGQAEIKKIEQESPKVNKVRESTILFKLKENATPSQLKSFNALVNANTILERKEIKGLKIDLVKIKNIKGSEKTFSKKLLATGAVKFAEPDMIISPSYTPNDAYYGVQWHHSTINSPTAWQNTQGSESIKVCVLDTGVDTDHPDLINNLLLPGYNAYYEQDGNVEDLYGHGTGTAGVIGAVGNNAIGVAGVNWNVKIIPVQISQGAITSSAYISDMAVGIRWCADQGVKVANLSYGGAQYATISDAAQYLKDRGGLLFMSAGNDGVSHTTTEFPDYSSFVIVGSTNSSDMKSSFSEYGPYIDVTAPGESIATTYLDGQYVYYSGTSFSSPMTAGLAALLLSVNSSLTPADIENYIFSTAADLGLYGEDDEFGHGRIDVGAAINKVINDFSTNEMPTAVATSSATTGYTPLNVTFTSSSTDPDGVIVSHLWDLGDGNTLLGENVNHTFTQAGTYSVTLTVTDDEGAQNTSEPILIDVMETMDTIATPTNLAATVDETLNSVTLTWSHNLSNTGGFEIYRAEKRRGKYNFTLHATSEAATSYVDEKVDAGNYKYIIKAISADAQYSSEFSNEILVVVQTGLPADTSSLLAPELSISNSGSNITLSWTHECPEAEVCSYEVQRGVKSKGKSSFTTMFSNVESNTVSFTENLGSYTYRVSSSTANETSDYSNTVNIRIK